MSQGDEFPWDPFVFAIKIKPPAMQVCSQLALASSENLL